MLSVLQAKTKDDHSVTDQTREQLLFSAIMEAQTTRSRAEIVTNKETVTTTEPAN